jgi:hypothetical protein
MILGVCAVQQQCGVQAVSRALQFACAIACCSAPAVAPDKSCCAACTSVMAKRQRSAHVTELLNAEKCITWSVAAHSSVCMSVVQLLLHNTDDKLLQ